MQKPLIQSVLFHLLIAILLVASSWSLFSRKEKKLEERAIVVQLAPLGEKTNLKPAPKRDSKPPQEKKPQTKPAEKKPVAKKPEPKKPESKPEPKKPEPKKPEPKKPDPAKKPEPKPEEKKPEPKKQKEKPKDELEEMLEKLDKVEKTDKKQDKTEDSELNNMLRDLDKNKPEAKSSNATENTDENSKSDLPFDANAPVSVSELDYITSLIVDQIKMCWSPPAGVRDAKDLVVRINVDIAQNGVIKFVGFEGSGSGVVYQAAADSARRAVLDPECNPLKKLPPPNKYYI